MVCRSWEQSDVPAFAIRTSSLPAFSATAAAAAFASSSDGTSSFRTTMLPRSFARACSSVARDGSRAVAKTSVFWREESFETRLRPMPFGRLAPVTGGQWRTGQPPQDTGVQKVA